MTASIKVIRIVHSLALALWAGAMISAGVAAINVFGTLGPDFGLTMDRYAGVPTQEHARLAASHVMEGVFFTVDAVQFVAAPIALLAFAIEVLIFKARLGRPANIVRVLTLGAAATLLAYHAAALAPLMNQQLRERWKASERGDLPTAEAMRASFNGYHEKADLVLRVNLLLVLTAIGAGAAAGVEPKREHNEGLPKPSLVR